MSQQDMVRRDLCKGCPDNAGKDGDNVLCRCVAKMVVRVTMKLPRKEGNNRNLCPNRAKSMVRGT